MNMDHDHVHLIFDGLYTYETKLIVLNLPTSKHNKICTNILLIENKDLFNFTHHALDIMLSRHFELHKMQ